ncbi:mucin-2-like [Anneissia japonica]|uniref:mucin-2-like n=1 Tax=Anneissia japonica TaxID=1529436 RepID=UPI0014254D1A|nr:mucin-2-like [Anneissia japonica]
MVYHRGKLPTMTFSWSLYFLVFVGYLAVTNASHFRFATFSWKPVGPIVNSMQTVELQYRIGWARVSTEGGTCDAQLIQDGTEFRGRKIKCEGDSCTTYDELGRTTEACTDVSIRDNWMSGQGSSSWTFPINNDYAYGITVSTAWPENVGTVDRQAVAAFSMDLVMRGDTVNSSPKTTMLTLLKLRQSCETVIRIPVYDADGDDVQCRRATGQDECGSVCDSLTDATISSDCVLTFTPPDVGRLAYAVTLIVEDYSAGVALSRIPLQFLINVFEPTVNDNCNDKPTFIDDTPLDQSEYGVITDGTLTLKITAMSSADGATIVAIDTTSPLRMFKSELMTTENTQISYVDITYTPTSNNSVEQFCFTAEDSYGLTANLRCLTVFTGAKSLGINIDSLVPPSGSQITLSNDITFVNFSVQFDSTVNRPYSTAFIRFFNESNNQEVLAIDTSTSSDVSFDGNNTVRFKVASSTLAFGSYYILMDSGTVMNLLNPFVGFSDTSFWTFQILDPGSSCAINPCMNGGTCSDDEDSFQCECPFSWTGETCETAHQFCRVYGTSHVMPFEGETYSLNNPCQYTLLASNCTGITDPENSYKITGIHEEENEYTASLSSVIIEVLGMTIQFYRDLSLSINNRSSATPASPVDGLQINNNGGNLILYTNFSLIVVLSQEGNLLLSVDDGSTAEVCGLCRPYNGSNYVASSGMVDDFELFLESWSAENCSLSMKNCSGNVADEELSAACSVISSDAFADCHSLVPFEPFLDSCLYDVCASGGSTGNCSVIAAYQQACTQYGITVGEWRTDGSCGNNTLGRREKSLGSEAVYCYTILYTNFSLILVLSQEGNLLLSVDDDSTAEVCGLCRPYNGSNYVASNGMVDDFELFLESWSAENCSLSMKNCSGNVADDELSAACSVISSDAFADCHSLVPFEPFLDSCLYDVCASGGSTGNCSVITAYQQACTQYGITVGEWRTDGSCDFECGGYSEYSACEDPCVRTCPVSQPVPEYCDLPCLESCVCEQNYILNNGACVPVEDCGCVYEGNYYPESTFLLSTCVECTCGDGNAMCGNESVCHVNASCLIDDKKPGCYCNEGYEGDGLNCLGPDTIEPEITCPTNVTSENFTPEVKAGFLTVSTDEGKDYATVTWNPPIVSDNRNGTINVTVSPYQSGDRIADTVNKITLTFTATDEAGNSASCDFCFFILDDERPNIECPELIERTALSGNNNVSINYDIVVSDNVLVSMLNSNYSDLSIASSALGYFVDEKLETIPTTGIFPVGETVVMYIVSDTRSPVANMNNCYVTVVVTEDTIEPEITCPTNVTSENFNPEVKAGFLTVSTDEGKDYATVTWNPPIVSDNSNGTINVTVSPYQSGDRIADTLNKITLTFTATDEAGNSASCDFCFFILDDEPPNIECPELIERTVLPGNNNASINYDIVVSDNVLVSRLNSNYSDLSIASSALDYFVDEKSETIPTTGIFPVGETVVMYIVSDTRSPVANMNNCYVTVVVTEDTIEPEITCPTNVTSENFNPEVKAGFLTVSTDEGKDYATVTWNPPIVSDNRNGTINVTVSPYQSGDRIADTVNKITLTFTATDEAGNSASCDFCFFILGEFTRKEIPL